MTQMPEESFCDVRAHLAEVVERAERETNRIIDERMANRSAGVPIEDVMRETLARSE